MRPSFAARGMSVEVIFASLSKAIVAVTRPPVCAETSLANVASPVPEILLCGYSVTIRHVAWAWAGEARDAKARARRAIQAGRDLREKADLVFGTTVDCIREASGISRSLQSTASRPLRQPQGSGGPRAASSITSPSGRAATSDSRRHPVHPARGSERSACPDAWCSGRFAGVHENL